MLSLLNSSPTTRRLVLEPYPIEYEQPPGTTYHLVVIEPLGEPPTVEVKEDGSVVIWCHGFASLFYEGNELVANLPDRMGPWPE